MTIPDSDLYLIFAFGVAALGYVIRLERKLTQVCTDIAWLKRNCQLKPPSELRTLDDAD